MSAKFRSLDISNYITDRVGHMRSEERPPMKVEDKAKYWQQQEMLTDLKEASKEGGNSISLSPQRNVLPGIAKNQKIPTLKKSKQTVTNTKAKTKLDDVAVTYDPPSKKPSTKK